MQKKLKRIIKIMLIITIVATSFPPIEVQASNFTDRVRLGEIIPDIYYRRRTDDGRVFIERARFIRRHSDWHFMYCLQPGVAINENLVYNGTDRDWATFANLTEAQWTRIALLAYYGYGFQDANHNHSDPVWYAVTQFMIWHVAEPTWDMYWTDTLNGNRITRFEEEMAILNRLVDSHFVVPSFQGTNHRILLGDTLTLTDTNNVLYRFNVSTNNTAEANINGNRLNITPDSTGNTTLTLTKSTGRWRTPPIVYVHPNSQDVFTVGDFDPVVLRLNVNVDGGRININKIGEELIKDFASWHFNNIRLAGVEFGLFADENIMLGNRVLHERGSLITTLTTDADGNIDFADLPRGRYFLQELSTVGNHVLDTTKYRFEISESGLSHSFEFENRLIRGRLELTKVSSATGLGIPNTLFEIFTMDHQLIFRGMTDENGQIILDDLFVGRFYIKEVMPATGYLITDQLIFFEITEDGQVIQESLVNSRISVPSTGLDANDLHSVIGILSIIVAGGVFIYAKKSKTKIKKD